ncbi:Alpha/beta knot methyltransferase [Dunaliella salina]|uniref:Alpha/beta knot methyltransferase n=1 Tax=Dunaliella salina TaxID=3046 RepID=A0ABQ7H1L6_DUNSA|nr:Alpha/beta knot methyltransferase [Dunaliella salina]|eukprot:KAF5840722.1 Alpha/beta knot methyltransferase [Dunaliella salina]
MQQSWAQITSTHAWLFRAGGLRCISNLRHVGRAAAAPDASADVLRITSTGNAFVKHCVKLRTSSKYRAEEGAILLVGSELLQEAAGAAAGVRLHVRTLILGEGVPPTQAAGARLLAHRTVVATEPVMKKLTGLESAAKVDAAAEVDLPKPVDFLRDWLPGRATSSSVSQDAAFPSSTPLSSHPLQGISGKRRVNSRGEVPQAYLDRSSCIEGSLPVSASKETVESDEASPGKQQHEQCASMGPSQSMPVGSSQRMSLPEQPGGSNPIPSNESSSSKSQQGIKGGKERGSSHSRPLRRLLALDGVQDPGNLGTLMRSALAFGWDGVYLLQGCCSPFNDKAIKSSRGAVLRIAIGSGSLPELLQIAERHQLRLIAADPEPPAEQQSPHPGTSSGIQGEVQPNQHGSAAAAAPGGVCLVLGSEGQGLSPATSDVCVPVAIPMAGRMESLNVGIAGGILMWALSEGGTPKLLSRLESLGLHSTQHFNS